MPIYEYVCRACGGETELMQKISDPPATKCPLCGRNQLVKHVSAAGFRLAGSGWYETDFKKSDDRKKNLVGDKAEGKSEPKTEAGSEAKAETKADSKPATKSADAKPAKSEKAKPKTTSSKSAGK